MSVLEGSVSCVPHLAETDTKNNDIANSDSASVLDAETVQNTNTLNSHVEEETLNDNELLKGLLTDSFCQVCEAVLLFESQRVSHYEGKKHAQRVRVYLQTKKAERNKQKQEFDRFQHGNVDPEKLCELCNMVFSSPVVARSHYEGKVHAKNVRKSSTTPYVADVRSTVKSPVTPAPTGHGAPRGETDQGPESTVPNPHGVDLDDPEKYCKLCTVSFNNPLMAQQHYSGRKHQRNQARQELLCRLGEESEHVHSLTCPVCCVTLSSIETYQAHMQGNKHHIQEKKIVGLCKSQKKVYDSFQDELADYIQVQRARGLEPKTGQGSEAPAHSTAEEKAKDTVQDVEETLPSAPLSHAPPPSLHPPQWHQLFNPQLDQFALRGKFPMQKQWNQGYPSHPPPLIPGLTGRSSHRGRSPISSSSSSFSDSSSSYSSSSGSSSISSSEDSRGRRRRRRKRRDGARSRREQDDGSTKDAERRQSKRRSRKEGEEERGDPRKVRRHRKMSFEEEQGEQGVGEDPGRRKEKDEGAKGRDSDDGEDHGRKRRAGKRNKRQKEGHYGKRWREEGVGEWSKGSAEGGGLDEGMPATVEDHLRDRPEDERAKCKREKKKKTKDKNDEGDTRTEEEKLWDETILGLF